MPVQIDPNCVVY